MPRMLFWNVEHFSADKFFRRRRKRSRDGEETWGANAAQEYLDVLFYAITTNDPDFIVIVEARPAGIAPQGTLLTDDGTMQLLDYLRYNDDAQWALVPPVISGTGRRGEGIAVFYRRTPTLFFTGPWVWPGGAGPAVPAGASGVYPAAYRWAFSQPVSPRRTPNDGINLHNPNVFERRLAGQWRFRDGGGAVLNFGGAGTRSPFLTTFYDSAARQNYTIVACHTAPSQDGGVLGVANAPSTLATAAVGNLREVRRALAPGAERIVVVGDFNVSLFDAIARATAYAPFAGGAWTRVISSNPGHGIPVDYPRRGFLVTHIRTAFEGTPDNADGYPAFGYGSVRTRIRGRGTWVDYDSIDNGFVRGGGGVANQTIVNVVGRSPYNAAVWPNVPQGALVYTSQMNDPASLNLPAGYVRNGANWDDEVELFQDIDNYGRVRGVSDHLPIAFDF